MQITALKPTPLNRKPLIYSEKNSTIKNNSNAVNKSTREPRIKTNFKELFNDLEFWNILTLKTETFFIELSHVKSHKRTFLLIEKYLNQYLDNN